MSSQPVEKEVGGSIVRELRVAEQCIHRREQHKVPQWQLELNRRAMQVQGAVDLCVEDSFNTWPVELPSTDGSACVGERARDVRVTMLSSRARPPLTVAVTVEGRRTRGRSRPADDMTEAGRQRFSDPGIMAAAAGARCRTHPSRNCLMKATISASSNPIR